MRGPGVINNPPNIWHFVSFNNINSVLMTNAESVLMTNAESVLMTNAE
jgi:hypothetical protein